MVRGKTEMKRIENKTSRQVSFSKRKSGLFKKAFELSVLCDATVSLIVFSSNAKLFEFSSSSCPDETIERYEKHAKNAKLYKGAIEESMQHIQEEIATISKKIVLLENSKRKLMGEALEGCSTDELQKTEDQLEQSFKNIRARKNFLYKQRIIHLKEEEETLLQENVELRKKVDVKSLFLSATQEDITSKKIMDVETLIFIGPKEGSPN